MSYYMNMSSFNEGEQAEAYKKKKADEKHEYINIPDERFDKRYDNKRVRDMDSSEMLPNTKFDRHTYHTTDDDKRLKDNKNMSAQQKQNHSDKMYKNRTKAFDMVAKDANRREFENYWNSYSGNKDSNKHGYSSPAVDAAARHMRRHPKQYQECGIFSEVTFLDEI